MDRTGAAKPTFLWRGILILLPLLLLAGMGLYSLRQDRLLAEVEAKQRCQELVENYATTISTRLLTRMTRRGDLQGLDAIMEVDEHGNPLAITGSRERAIIPRNPIPHPPTETNLSRAQAAAWHKARQTEFTRADASVAIRDWRKFIELSPPAPFLTQARYDLGLMLAAHHEATEADQLFSEVQRDHAAFTDSGLPLWLLAEVQRVELARPSMLVFQQTCRDVVFHPTFATPAILAALTRLDPTGAMISRVWLDRWRDDQATRDFYFHTREDVVNDPVRRAFWTKWEGTSWLVLLVPSIGSQTKLLRFDRDIVAQALQDVLTTNLTQMKYAKLGVEIAGKPVLSVDPQWPVLGSASAALIPESTTKTVTVYESLSKPGLLYAQQRARTAWFAALILVSAMAALIGFVSAYRGFHQQLRLSEMKSNFVSSVSHELRAPIASMRLLAESLERGKVLDEAKQQEYFGFLVQESRRLSSLIENILDFSRIEQGRKKYQFESTDLDILVEQTLKLMQPCAAERGVELKLQKPAVSGHEAVHCDGLAVQQALINLIDNAIKHSPAGAAVMIGLERGPGNFRLWVEDRGPGIPAEDHERIFERFYRRGSELRRETQGIGIGLTIVKHSVEAHGGRVVLRSAVGQGSRFAIELPNQPAAEEQK